MTTNESRLPQAIQVQVHPTMSSGLSRYATDKLTAALRLAPAPVLYARVRLERSTDPAVARPARARVEVDLNGRILCASADAVTGEAAVDRLQNRLRVQLARHSRR
jgi:ribosome-associated translation inhibitor RaiA